MPLQIEDYAIIATAKRPPWSAVTARSTGCAGHGLMRWLAWPPGSAAPIMAAGSLLGRHADARAVRAGARPPQ
jgi:hypothetical protein